jgi:hypothetical protein
MTEVWRDIPGFAQYQASDQGHVRNKSTLAVLTTNKFGKTQLWINGRNKSIRTGRLVLLAFEGPPSNPFAQLARHLDDDIFNNLPENLAWGSTGDNSKDAIRNGTDYGKSWRGRKQPPEMVTKKANANRHPRGPYKARGADYACS